MNENELYSFNGLVTHKGEEFQEAYVLLSPPPSEIGELRSAFSTLCESTFNRTVLNRIMYALTIGIFCSLLFLFAAGIFHDIHPDNWQQALDDYISSMAIVCLIVTLFIFLLRRRKHISTYVGTNGIAKFTCFEDQLDGCVNSHILSFKDASELRWIFNDVFVHGGYSGSSFVFRWLNSNQQEVFLINGSFHDKDYSPPLDNEYYFAAAAQTSWNHIQYERSIQELKQNGFASFRVFESDMISVGVGYLEFVFDGTSVRLPPDEVELFTLREGALHVESRTLKFYRNSRECRINTGRISNLDQLVKLAVDESGFIFVDE
ncbi:hypothetical protein [Rubinisphaera italica]|uniref:Uncharacterized protein n=1 Tax=Rubinisphaera italica TaxID=2527969 RepID=A0A5C5XJH4_9PLAN|nr:hypothetical protein [Rubinisphaera italica]TWT63120.1 hypothetical protein Pan54_38720 [Rubinisphaera italica]